MYQSRLLKSPSININQGFITNYSLNRLLWQLHFIFLYLTKIKFFFSDTLKELNGFQADVFVFYNFGKTFKIKIVT